MRLPRFPLELVGLGLVGLTLGGCLGGPEAPQIRFYRPALPPIVAVTPSSTTAGGRGTSLLIEPVTAAGHLDAAIAWQTNEVEYGYYPDRYWTEHPSHYVQEALEREFYDRRGYRPAQGLNFETLKVHVDGFQESRYPGHVARIRLRALFRFDGRERAVVRTFELDRPLADETGDIVARGLGEGLQQLVAEIANWIESTPRRAGE